ncbi:MAG TPA: hypothetical protein VMQ44_01400 [Candidatus Saccharimonadales bacterium]|nr:hypothetical protein [Candidatus Saccharimonadales bacterium]
MTVRTDHDQEIDVTGKIEQMADLTRHSARKALKEGTLTPDMLQSINENGGLFLELAMPELIRIMVKIGMIGKMIDSALLEPFTMVSYPAVEAFSAKEKFAIGTQDGVVIGWLGDNFKKHFSGKNEIDVPAQQLRVHRLRKNSVDGLIIKELGGEEIVETNLATMFGAMEKQGAGQAGDLLVNGYANIFYIRDDAGTIWAVRCDWCSDCRCWFVEAYPLTGPRDWRADSQVFSR